MLLLGALSPSPTSDTRPSVGSPESLTWTSPAGCPESAGVRALTEAYLGRPLPSDLDGGVTINRPPRDGHMAFVRSPDGVSIELLQKGESLAPQEPWASMENTGKW